MLDRSVLSILSSREECEKPQNLNNISIWAGAVFDSDTCVYFRALNLPCMEFALNLPCLEFALYFLALKLLVGVHSVRSYQWYVCSTPVAIEIGVAYFYKVTKENTACQNELLGFAHVLVYLAFVRTFSLPHILGFDNQKANRRKENGKCIYTCEQEHGYFILSTALSYFFHPTISKTHHYRCRKPSYCFARRHNTGPFSFSVFTNFHKTLDRQKCSGMQN